MPIRFSGSARPRKLKSPDPINMPSVRENIITRQKEEVDYYKANGELPTVAPKFSNITDYFVLDNPAHGPVFSFDIYNDVMVLYASGAGQLQSYKRNSTTSAWELVSTLTITLTENDIQINAAAGKVFVGSPNTNTSQGRIGIMDFDVSTGVFANWTLAEAAPIGSYSYDGAQMVLMDDILYTMATAYNVNTVRSGLVVFRNTTTGAILTLNRDMPGTTTSGIGFNGQHAFGTNPGNVYMGISSARDGNRLLTATGANTPVEFNNGFIAVSQYNGTDTVSNIQTIPVTYSNTGIAVVSPGKFVVVVDDMDNTRSIKEYVWDGAQYNNTSTYKWEHTYSVFTTRILHNIHSLGDNAILAATTDGTGRIVKIV